jgi:squalene-hopene/tetraprenyl-beta-curcumene cyclase
MAARNAQGYWAGELSSSALSTATAVCALVTASRHSKQYAASLETLAQGGLEWLAAHANPDGGWGDTILSKSNISTTTLCWAAFGIMEEAGEHYAPVVRKAEAWIKTYTGGLDSERLAKSIIARYGEDRTFSVPILTTCAVCGRLGAGREAWRNVLQLPFELAACPSGWFGAIGLPVVSYALPALIAIGQARHFHAPSANPIARLTRDWTRQRTLRLLTEIQPASGGFLEATPLTSFVALSLAAADQADHPVTRKAIEFLKASVREDGSWPIDTNLATWLTTLSVNALAQDPGFEMPPETSSPIRNWLLMQQSKAEHPYTRAQPGAWAWTDLPGGVPDADDTAGALLALRHLGNDASSREAAREGVGWLLELQNRDGGIPTFCKGWGKLAFDRSSPDLTAHALRAWAAWKPDLPEALQRRVNAATRRAARYLAAASTEGGWAPLWFGNQHAPDETNLTYGNGRVLTACNSEMSALMPEVEPAMERAVTWLLRAQNEDGSWGGTPQGPPSIEETALAIEGLSGRLAMMGKRREANSLADAVRRGVAYLVKRIEDGTWTTPSPIGFYFAKLWYFEKLYPVIFTVSALGQAMRSPEFLLR